MDSRNYPFLHQWIAETSLCCIHGSKKLPFAASMDSRNYLCCTKSQENRSKQKVCIVTQRLLVCWSGLKSSTVGNYWKYICCISVLECCENTCYAKYMICECDIQSVYWYVMKTHAMLNICDVSVIYRALCLSCYSNRIIS